MSRVIVRYSEQFILAFTGILVSVQPHFPLLQQVLFLRTGVGRKRFFTFVILIFCVGI